MDSEFLTWFNDSRKDLIWIKAGPARSESSGPYLIIIAASSEIRERRVIATKISSPGHSASSLSVLMASSICDPHRIVSCPVINDSLKVSVSSIIGNHRKQDVRNSENIVGQQRSSFLVSSEVGALTRLHKTLQSISGLQYLLPTMDLPKAFCS